MHGPINSQPSYFNNIGQPKGMNWFPRDKRSSPPWRGDSVPGGAQLTSSTTE